MARRKRPELHRKEVPSAMDVVRIGPGAVALLRKHGLANAVSTKPSVASRQLTSFTRRWIFWCVAVAGGNPRFGELIEFLRSSPEVLEALSSVFLLGGDSAAKEALKHELHGILNNE